MIRRDGSCEVVGGEVIREAAHAAGLESQAWRGGATSLGSGCMHCVTSLSEGCDVKMLRLHALCNELDWGVPRHDAQTACIV